MICSSTSPAAAVELAFRTWRPRMTITSRLQSLENKKPKLAAGNAKPLFEQLLQQIADRVISPVTRRSNGFTGSGSQRMAGPFEKDAQECSLEIASLAWNAIKLGLTKSAQSLFTS